MLLHSLGILARYTARFEILARGMMKTKLLMVLQIGIGCRLGVRCPGILRRSVLNQLLLNDQILVGLRVGA